MKVYSISEARKIIGDLVASVKFGKQTVALGRNKKAEVLLIPYPELEEDLPITSINTSSESFSFLEDEADIYTVKDLKKRYV